MQVRVIRYQHQSRTLEMPGEDTTVLLFDPRCERGVESIGDRYRKLDVGARAAGLIVVRGSTPDFAGLVAADDLLRRRVGATPLLVLAPQADCHAPVLHEVDWANPPTTVPDVDVLRAAELRTGLRAQEAIFRHPGCHYLLPSAGYHADAFIRLEDALRDQTDLVRLTDWLVEKVDQDTALAADNGSLLGLLNALALRTAPRWGGGPPPIATLNEYPIGPTAIAETVDRFIAGGSRRLLFCVSVNSSGRVAREVAALDGVETEVVVMCETRAGGAVEGLETFAIEPIERWDVDVDGRCEMCAERHLLSVDPRSYEVRTQVRLRPTPPDIPYAAANDEFWEAARRRDAVRLHVDVPEHSGESAQPRHLAVHLDVAALLDDGWFRGRCIDALRAIETEGVPPPDLVLIPDHASRPALEKLVEEAFPLLERDRIRACVPTETAAALPEDRGSLDHVLVVDDALISGYSLVTIRQDVYSATHAVKHVRVSAFVAVSRPETLDDFDNVRRRFWQQAATGDSRGVPGLHAAQKLLLPGTDCPWCRERDRVIARLDTLKGEAREFAAERRVKLTGTLTAPLLLCGDAESGLTFGSFIGTLDSVAAFAAVSGLAQHMRAVMERDREGETIRILDVPLVLQAFFDPIIVGGLLRTFPRRDLRDPGNEPMVARTIAENAKHYPDATIAELAVAAMDGKLPPGPVRRLLEKREGAWAAALLGLLEGY